MAKKKEEAKPVVTPNKKLKAGMVLSKHNCVYDKQMIVSDKINVLGSVIYRECVAWNDERCRRFDTTEDELSEETRLGDLDPNSLADYISRNKRDEWNDPKIPQYKELKQ